MSHMTIGEFASESRLSTKALRLYDRLGLLVPIAVDPDSGYRFYAQDQVEEAQLVGHLRRLDMPLALIGRIVAAEPGEGARLLSEFWEQVETSVADRRVIVSYLRNRLTGGTPAMYEIQTRRVPERTVASMTRHVHSGTADSFFEEAFGLLRSLGPGLDGIAGCPFLIFYGEVSEDSDGPVELCRPLHPDGGGTPHPSAVQLRIDPAHEEVFIRLAAKDLGWPAMVPAVDALEVWASNEHRTPSGSLRQTFIADGRTASGETLACDLTIPLRAAAT